MSGVFNLATSSCNRLLSSVQQDFITQVHLRDTQRRSSMRSDKSPPTLDSYLALLQSYEAKKKYDTVSYPIVDIDAKVFSPGTTFQLSRRCFPSSIKAPKIVSPRMASVYDDMRSPHNGGETFESGYTEPTRTWRRSDGYFKVRSRPLVRVGQLSPRPHLDQKVESRRKGPRRSSLHSESSRRDSKVLLNNWHPRRLHPRYPRSVENRPLNRPVHCGRDLLSSSVERARSHQLRSVQVTNTHRV